MPIPGPNQYFEAVHGSTAGIIPTSSPLVAYINVGDYGAKGDGVTDDTGAINAAITAMNVAGGGTVYVPPSLNPYMVNADWLNRGSIQMKSNVDLVLARGATLKAITNSVQKYAVINAQNISNAGVYGGTILGERTTHTGIGGEWGHGIQLGQCTDFTIAGIKIKDCWGDGVYVGVYQDPISGLVTSSTECERVTLDRVVCDNNRRNGVSVTGSRNFKAENCHFLNANGTSPQAGIDLEPNPGVSVVEETSLVNCTSSGNTFYGFSVSGATGVILTNVRAINNGAYGYLITATSTRVQAAGATFVGNGALQIGWYNFVSGVTAASDTILRNYDCSGTYDKGYINKGPGAGNFGYGRNLLSGFKMSGTFNYGVYMETQADDNVAENGEVVGAANSGVLNVLGDGNTVRNVRVRNSLAYGIRFTAGSRNVVESCRSESNTLVGIYMSTGSFCKVKNCTSRLNGGNGIEWVSIDDGHVDGNTVETNSQTTDLASYNIRLSTGGNRNLVRGNTVRLGSLANRPAHGIFISAAGINDTQVLDNDTVTGGATREVADSGTRSVIRNKPAVVTLVYAASMSPAPLAGQKQLITVTDATAMTIAAPVDNGNALNYPGLRLTFEILNSSGGVMGAITWNAIYHLAGAFTNPASTKTRTITFVSNGSAWIEESRAAADI